MVDRRQVRHNREAELVPQERRHLTCTFARAAAGAIGDRDEVRPDASQRRRRLAQGLDAGVVPRGVELERAQRPAHGEQLGDGAVWLERRGGGHGRDDTAKAAPAGADRALTVALRESALDAMRPAATIDQCVDRR